MRHVFQFPDPSFAYTSGEQVLEPPLDAVRGGHKVQLDPPSMDENVFGSHGVQVIAAELEE